MSGRRAAPISGFVKFKKALKNSQILMSDPYAMLSIPTKERVAMSDFGLDPWDDWFFEDGEDEE